MNRRAKLLYLLFAGVCAWAAISLALQFSKPALPPAVPADFARLNPQLQAHLAKGIEEVRRSPRDADLHAALGLAYAANGLWAPAREEFEYAARLNSREPLARVYAAAAALELGNPEQALEQLRFVAQKFPACAPAWQRLGDLALRQGRLEEAERAFNQLTALAPKEYRGFSGLGQIRLRQNNPDEARGLLEKAIELDPQARKAHFLLGTALQALGQTNLAVIELCLGAGAQDTPMTDPWADAASAHMKNVADQIEMAREMRDHGEVEKAVGLLTAAVRFQPTNAALLHNLAISFNQLNRPDMALPLIQDALKQNPNDLTFRVALSYTEQLMGNSSNALQTAEQLIALAPNLSQAYLAKANALLALEKDQLAVDTLRQAVEVDPRNEGLYLEMGDILWQNLEQPDAAIAAYRHALEIKPCSARAYFSLAGIHDRLGNQEERRRCLKLARQLAAAEGWQPPVARAKNK